MNDEHQGKVAYTILETVRDEQGNFVPCIVKEGHTGYWKTDFHWGDDIEQARELAKEYNEKMGLSEEQVMEMVLKSMKDSYTLEEMSNKDLIIEVSNLTWCPDENCSSCRRNKMLLNTLKRRLAVEGEIFLDSAHGSL